MTIEVKQNRQDNHNFFVIKYKDIEEWNDYKSWFEYLINATQADVFDNNKSQDFLKDKKFIQKSLDILDHCYHNDKYDKDNEVSVIVSTSEMLSICLALFEMITNLRCYIVSDIQEALISTREEGIQKAREVLDLAKRMKEMHEKFVALDNAKASITADMTLTEIKAVFEKYGLEDIVNGLEKETE